MKTQNLGKWYEDDKTASENEMLVLSVDYENDRINVLLNGLFQCITPSEYIEFKKAKAGNIIE